MTELWRRWHITLTAWFRDYVWTPLKGTLRNLPAHGAYFRFRMVCNFFIVFTISGLWHGAGWPFVLWGLLNGCVVAGEHFLKTPGRDSQRRTTAGRASALGSIRTYVIFALLLVIFRAPTLSDGGYALLHLSFQPLRDGLATAHCGMIQLTLGILGVMTLMVLEMMIAKYPVTATVARWPMMVRWNCYAGVVLAIVFLGIFEKTPFFYFQF